MLRQLFVFVSIFVLVLRRSQKVWACYCGSDKLEHIKPVYAGSHGEHGVDYEQVSFGEGAPGGYGFYQVVDENQYEKIEYDVEKEGYSGRIA